MAEAVVTKKAISEAFRTLITEMPLSKISIGDICERCELNRKSFYYHYKDKYDLANSCFDTDFPYLTIAPDSIDSENILFLLCNYLYKNRIQYKRLFENEGQNSFYDHLRANLRIYFQYRLSDKSNFSATFWSDAVSFSIKEWICAKKPAHYDDFYSQLISCIRIDGRLL